jgi:hypothetical protein
MFTIYRPIGNGKEVGFLVFKDIRHFYVAVCNNLVSRIMEEK